MDRAFRSLGLLSVATVRKCLSGGSSFAESNKQGAESRETMGWTSHNGTLTTWGYKRSSHPRAALFWWTSWPTKKTGASILIQSVQKVIILSETQKCYDPDSSCVWSDHITHPVDYSRRLDNLIATLGLAIVKIRCASIEQTVRKVSYPVPVLKFTSRSSSNSIPSCSWELKQKLFRGFL